MNEESSDKSALVPRLRFPEFLGAGEWEKKSLADVCLKITNGKANAEDHEDDGVYPLYDRSEVVKKSSEYVFDDEAVIIPGEGMRFQPKYYKGKFNLHQRAYALMQHQGNAEFVYYTLDRFKDTLAKNAVKSTVLSLRLPIIERFSLAVPDNSEQKKIADCLSSLDELITAETQKLDALKTHKKGLMQQLFPCDGEAVPRLRFPGFRKAGKWEERKLGTVCDIQRGKFSHRPRNDPRFFGGPYPFIQTGDVVKSEGGAIVASQSLNEDGLAVSKLFKPTIVLITIAANIGDTGLLQTEGCFTDSVVGLIPQKDVIPVFLELIMRGQKENLNKVATTGAQKNINNEILREVSVLLPSVPEQQRIADCLSSLDDLITAQSQKIDALKTHKKGLMQQLFPVLDEVQA